MSLHVCIYIYIFFFFFFFGGGGAGLSKTLLHVILDIERKTVVLELPGPASGDNPWIGSTQHERAQTENRRNPSNKPPFVAPAVLSCLFWFLHGS